MGYIHFFDDWQLIGYQNLERYQGRPEYVPDATLEDSLCEGTWDFPCVARLPESGKYVAIYGAAPPSGTMSVIEIPEGTDQNVSPRSPIICYAESDDGINWTKPDLRNIAKFDGPCLADNQVFGLPNGVEGGPAYFDKYDPDPNRRFKLLINLDKGRALVTSPDGINWKISHHFKSQRATDTPTSVFYNPQIQKYTFNVRQYPGDRRVFFFDTDDWENFTNPEMVMHPCPQDPPLVGFYAMPTFEYEDIFIGLLWRIHCDPASNMLPNGAIDCDLAYSYDGKHFNRTFYNAFIPRNKLGEHGGGCVYTGAMFVDENDQIRFYSGGSKAEHFQNQELTDAALMMHIMRLDGFSYLATPTGKGSLRTRAMIIHGDDLRINVRCPWGRVRVQILDEKAQVIPGFSYNDCDEFSGDELYWKPSWKGKTFGEVKGTERRQLEIEIVTGEIYAIRGDFELVTCLWDGVGNH